MLSPPLFIKVLFRGLNGLLLVSGWLDDIGLPQYKSNFDEARVDGRMLHYMTVVSHRDLTSRFIPRDEMTHLLAGFPGGPAVSEGGQRSPSPQHQEGHSGPPHQLLRPQLSAATSL